MPGCGVSCVLAMVIPVSCAGAEASTPQDGKHLEVRYSFARERAITVPESEYLKLPEKKGEERGRKELQAMKARVDSMITAEDVLISGLSATEHSLFITTKAEFVSLPWCQRLR